MNLKPLIILLAEDDFEDRILVKEAFGENKLANQLNMVEDGQELLDYLDRKGKFNDPVKYPIPDLILLDLNMPRKNGIEALKEIKLSENKHIPVIVLTTSEAESDVVKSYKLGVSSYIVKPVSFEKMVEIIGSFSEYWFQLVKLPPKNNLHLDKQ
ncbi:MAG: response regulator [Calditrichaeota bacterium]|nr:MAG: response regulator [Calditrichota bacterium]